MRASVSIQPILPFGTAVKGLPRLVEALAEACREAPLEEKALIAQSRFVGHQLIEALARSGTPWAVSYTHLTLPTICSV